MEAIVTLQFNGTDVTVGKLFTSIRRGRIAQFDHRAQSKTRDSRNAR